MVHLQAVNMIRAPIAKCFELSLSIDLEKDASSEFDLQAVAGVTTGMIRAGERVTWKAKQFGIWVEHTTEITRFEPPTYFQDSMIAGVFRYFKHDHYFVALDASRTEMRDDMFFAMPHWLGSVAVEKLLVRRRMLTLLSRRNVAIRREAEAAPFS